MTPPLLVRIMDKTHNMAPAEKQALQMDLARKFSQIKQVSNIQTYFQEFEHLEQQAEYLGMARVPSVQAGDFARGLNPECQRIYNAHVMAKAIADVEGTTTLADGYKAVYEVVVRGLSAQGWVDSYSGGAERPPCVAAATSLTQTPQPGSGKMHCKLCEVTGKNPAAIGSYHTDDCKQLKRAPGTMTLVRVRAPSQEKGRSDHVAAVAAAMEPTEMYFGFGAVQSSPTDEEPQNDNDHLALAAKTATMLGSSKANAPLDSILDRGARTTYMGSTTSWDPSRAYRNLSTFRVYRETSRSGTLQSTRFWARFMCSKAWCET